MPEPYAELMRRALRLVEQATHRSSPNPQVGCVIARGDAVVGEGVSEPAGGPHAEVLALHEAGPLARGATVYVTLEPCCHFGRTPPCVDALIDAGVARVVVGVIDPNPRVDGGGIAALRAAGIQVDIGLLADACARQLAPFLKSVATGRPWVILKAAVTLDGRIATASGDSRWITGEAARADVHRLRARSDVVLVGSGTALADDPRLDVRLGAAAGRAADPLVAVLDSHLRLPSTAALLGPRAHLFHRPDADADRAAALRSTGATLHAVPAGPHGLDLATVLDVLHARGCLSVLVEGGGQVHAALLEGRFADEACLYVAPRLLGRGRPLIDAPSVATVASGWSLSEPAVERFGDDVRFRGPIRYPAALQE